MYHNKQGHRNQGHRTIAIRYMYIMDTLKSTKRPMKCKELAVQLNISDRTIYRDLNDLSRYFPITSDKRGYFLMEV